MDNDAAATEQGRRIGAVRRVHLVVVNQPATRIVPDADAEFVLAAAAGLLPVNGCQDEAIIARVVDAARAFVLRPRSGNYQPFVSRAVKVQTARLELELGVASRDSRPVVILRDKAEVSFARQCLIGNVSARWRIDPAAARHKARARIVNHHQR
jgi:hypothetical protein